MSSPHRSRSVSTAVSLLFFSGISALIYQTIWIKQLTLVVGVDVYAITVGVSGFFAGLAIGSAVFGRLADRLERPLLLYAGLEVGIAILGVAATVALASAAPLFVALEHSAGFFAWAVPYALVALPAVLMGGTLPPLLAAVRPEDGAIGRVSGQLYAANTAGAIVGTLLTVFIVIPALGIRGAGLIAGTLNLLLACAALWLARRTSRQANPLAPSAIGHANISADARVALALYALAGGVALGYEIIWTQVIVQFLSTRAVAFAVVLATYLLGLVIGAWAYARIADRVEARWRAFGLLIAGAGICTLATFALLGVWLPDAQDALGRFVLDFTGNRMLSMCSRFALATGVVVLPPTLLLGAAFPAATRLAVRPDAVGGDVGLVLALNTALGIAGTMFTGFVLIPQLGLAGSLGALAIVAALLGGVAIARESNFRWQAVAVSAAVVATIAIVAIGVPRDHLATLLAEARGGDVVFYDEGPGGTVAVIEQPTPRGRFRRLYIQGVSNSGDVMPSRRYMRLQSLLPLIVHPGEPKSALVIAFGTGITAGSLLAYPDLERRLVVELLRPVVDAAPLFDGNYGAGSDPRLEVVIADGRHELLRRDESFDLITLEPPPPAAAGVVNLYSREFYELARKRLTNNGLLAQWLPITSQNDEDSQSLVRSMLDVFPYVTLWTTEVHEMMLIGSRQPLVLDYATIETRFAAPDVRQALREVGINSPAELIATYITDRTGLERYAAGALPVTDDRPRIEYAGWVRPREIVRVLPKLLALSSPLPLTATDAELARVAAAYGRLLDFYEIAYRAYGRDRARWMAGLRAFRLSGEPNAYFDWYEPP
ncbi:MAG: fused MFS/spermidine synthase [Gammaproteobacteria bacterium]